MNLSPDWCEVLRRHGWHAVHWSEVGSPTAPDKEVMSYARQNDCIVFTHDLDFSAILAVTQASAPSIIQVRARDTLSPQFRSLLVDGLRQFEAQLKSGAIVVLDQSRARPNGPTPGKTGC